MTKETDDGIPPILKWKGLKLIAMGTDKDGFFLKFAANRRPRGGQWAREVTLYMTTKDPVAWTYTYAIWDETTRTVTTYSGKHGDPSRDRIIGIGGK